MDEPNRKVDKAIQHRWSYLPRTCIVQQSLIEPANDALYGRLIQKILGLDSVDGDLKKLISLPYRLGGLNVCDKVVAAKFAVENSLSMWRGDQLLNAWKEGSWLLDIRIFLDKFGRQTSSLSQDGRREYSDYIRSIRARIGTKMTKAVSVIIRMKSASGTSSRQDITGHDDLIKRRGELITTF
ncbi:hypothetical protein GJ496_004839 [Pomphorhynchus laevis]|nr:hypothetical protein GJ496_004839 [Pomphorhynchus laevis]